MAQIQTLQSAALLAIAIWYRGNKLMTPPGLVHIQNPLAGDFWERLQAMSGEDDTDELARKLLGFRDKVTGSGQPFSLSGDDQENLRRLVSQIELDAMSGNIFMPGPSRSQHQAAIPSVFHWALENERGPYMSHRNITSATLRAARTRPIQTRRRRAPRRPPAT